MMGAQLNREAKERLTQRLLFWTTAILLTLAGVAWGSRYGGSTPPATVPPTSYENGLLNAPNPIDHSSNLPITGNVLGGKHFRGNIPYNSTSSFAAPLGSTSLDSFLRYSAVPEVRTSYPRGYAPFYSPSGTVTTTIPGYQGIFSPVSPKIAGGSSPTRSSSYLDAMADVPESSSTAGERDSLLNSSGIAASPRLQYWPMAERPEEMKDIVPNELGEPFANRSATQPGSSPMSAEEYQARLEQLRREVERIQAGSAQLGQNLNVDRGATPPQASLQQTIQAPSQPLSPRPVQDSTNSVRDNPTEKLHTIPPVSPGLTLYDPSALAEQAPVKPPVETGTVGDESHVAKLPASQRMEDASRRFDAASRLLDPSKNEPGTSNRARAAAPEVAPADRNDAQPDSRPQPSLQTYENAGSLAKQQFDQYMAAGELHMQQGRFYRAVESFTLASVYVLDDPRPHLGKSHALLAAGEYVSSAAFLAKAIDLNAESALRKLDLVERIGGPDPFVQRIGNLEERVRAGNVPELQFLLAYVYLQMDLPVEAKTAIDTVRRSLPSSVAVDRLAAAIEGTTGNPATK